MSQPNVLTSRRTALAGALAGLVAVAGCDGDSESGEPAAEPTTAPAVDADADLVERVQEQTLQALAMVTSIRQEQPQLRPRLRPLVGLHGAHLRALGFEGERLAASTYEAGTADLELLRSSEGRLQRQLTDAAVRAESGALAKLLASMAAAVAQHLAVLA